MGRRVVRRRRPDARPARCRDRRAGACRLRDSLRRARQLRGICERSRGRRCGDRRVVARPGPDADAAIRPGDLPDLRRARHHVRAAAANGRGDRSGRNGGIQRRCRNAVDPRLLHPFKRYLVYYDGPPFRSSICGTSAGRFERGPSSSVVWLNACRGAPRDYVAAHELLHALGAVPDGAPNTCRRDAGHVCDAPDDILQPEVSGLTLSEEALDFGHDDYYAHSGSWPDIQDSAWLRRLDRPQSRLSIVLQGQGASPRTCRGSTAPRPARPTGTQDHSSLSPPTAPRRHASSAGAARAAGRRLRPLDEHAADGDGSVRAARDQVSASVAGRGRVACSPRLHHAASPPARP